jgi:hypothetical protein
MAELPTPAPRTALMMVTRKDRAPTLAEAADELGVEVTDLDADFGVVEIDPEQGSYCVQVAVDRLPPSAMPNQPFRGPFSNPRIEHFGQFRESSRDE